ncbi:MAG: type II secretion system F family protein [Actinobacteria bacterium]|nr:type II secretion system F family protein [Actinomycetota bacterium]
MKYGVLILSLLILMIGIFIRVRKVSYDSEISKGKDKKIISLLTILDKTVSNVLVKKLVDKRFLTWIYLPFIKDGNSDEKVRLFTEKILFVFMWLICMFILPFRGFSLLLSTVVGLGLAFYFPDLNYLILQRKRSLASEKELPLAVDILTGMCESGLSIRSGLEMSAKVLKSSLREDVKLFCSGTAMGKGKEFILEKLRKKSLAPAVFDFFQMLSRFEEVGSPVNSYLSELSARLREDQLFGAEEHARRSQIISLFPLTFLILPSFLIMLVTIFLLPSFGFFNG